MLDKANTEKTADFGEFPKSGQKKTAVVAKLVQDRICTVSKI